MRRDQYLPHSLVLLILGCLWVCGDTSFANKPNIVLFVADDHGLDALGCYGNPVIKTPHLDQMAADGIRFTNAFCTSASCAASRSVILTGQYGHATGSYGHVHDYHHFSTFENVISLPVWLHENGYLTARIGKYHLAPEKVYAFDQVLKADPRNPVTMANACKAVLASDDPFFLYFCTDDPHRGHPFTPNPWNAPNSFGNKAEGYTGVKTIKYDPKDIIIPPFLPDTTECRREMAQYYQSVSRIDQGLGRLMELLERAGKHQNTIVIYISDNGIAFPGAKTTFYEPGMKLPCIIKHPEVPKKGIVNNAMITWADLTPTILDMAGIRFTPTDFHGRSFYSILSQSSPEGWDEIYAAHNFHELTMYYPMRVYRGRQYKLIWNIAWRLEYPFASDLWAASTWQSVYRNKIPRFGQRSVQDYLFRKEFELYDLNQDPGEIHNIANDPTHAEILEGMKTKLKDFQRKTNDPWLIMWDHDTSMQGTGVNL